MDLKEVKKIVELVEKSNITGLAVEKNGLKIEVKKEFPPVTHSVPIQASQPPVLTINEQKQISEEPLVKAEASKDKELTPVKSPMVGTFYAAPNPD